MQRYEIPFRPVFEGWASLVWIVAILSMYGLSRTTGLPSGPFVVASIIGGTMLIWRGSETIRRWREKRSLLQGKLWFVSWKRFLKQANKKRAVWCGKGFFWGREDLERAQEVMRRDPERFIGKKALKHGHQWLHGLGAAKEENVLLPQKFLPGQTLIVGTTGAGKTRCFDLLVAQAILRGEAVIIIDPKGDRDLRDNARRICELMGQPERFVFFHPAFPEECARIDPLRNWNRPTEIASRIASLIPSEAGADPFTAFGWNALNNIVNGLLACEERPNLVSLRRYIEGDPGPLVIRALRAHFQKHIEDWERRVAPYLKKMRGKDTEAYIQFYQAEIINEAPDSSLDGVISSYTHNREHFQKMIASLIPILSMLTSGDLGPLLSPVPDGKDLRPITDTARIINQGQVVYLGLDSLADGTVGSAIGSILLADLTAVAGDRYNYEVNNTPVNIFVDEAAEIINEPTIQLLNKGRGGGFQLVIATQTLADFEARLGSAAKARKVLGNTNNLIALRVLDGETQKYIAENLPLMMTRSLEEQYRSGSSSDTPGEFSGMYGESIKEEQTESFPPAYFGMLPDLHYMMKRTDGRIMKGKLPILVVGKKKKKPRKTKGENRVAIAGKAA